MASVEAPPHQKPAKSLNLIGGEYRNRTGVHGFAIRQESLSEQGDIVSKTALTNGELNENVSNAGLTGAKENPASTGMEHGAQIALEGVFSCGEHIPHFPTLAIHWGVLV